MLDHVLIDGEVLFDIRPVELSGHELLADLRTCLDWARQWPGRWLQRPVYGMAATPGPVMTSLASCGTTATVFRV
jgi:hypothetical protein